MTSRLPSLIVVLALAVLAGCSTLVPAPRVPASPPDAAHAAWARVLSSHVNEKGEVDFEALSRDRVDLDRYVRFVADTRPDSLPDPQARLAYMINAYNALVMFNLIESGIPRTHAGLNKLRFFVSRKLEIGGEAMSLYSYENDVIRPFTRSLGDPRVHFALNCSAVSCPVLPRVPFTGDALDAELEREARSFFARPQNFRIDSASRTVWLSEILSFYTEDFVPSAAAGSLIAFANGYAMIPAPLDYAVRFTPYDWTVANSRRPR